MQRWVLFVKQHDLYEGPEALYSGFVPSLGLSKISQLFEDFEFRQTDLGLG